MTPAKLNFNGQAVAAAALDVALFVSIAAALWIIGLKAHASVLVALVCIVLRRGAWRLFWPRS